MRRKSFKIFFLKELVIDMLRYFVLQYDCDIQIKICVNKSSRIYEAWVQVLIIIFIHKDSSFCQLWTLRSIGSEPWSFTFLYMLLWKKNSLNDQQWKCNWTFIVKWRLNLVQMRAQHVYEVRVLMVLNQNGLQYGPFYEIVLL